MRRVKPAEFDQPPKAAQNVAAQQKKYRNLRAYADDENNYPYPLPNSGEPRQQLIDGWFATVTRAPAEFVYNPPVITGGDEANGTVIADHLIGLLDASKSEILVESAYFIISDELLHRQ